MIPSIQVITTGDNRKFEIVAQHNINRMKKDGSVNVSKLTKTCNQLKEMYRVQFVLRNNKQPGLFFFCNEIQDAIYANNNDSNIYIKSLQLELFTEHNE